MLHWIYPVTIETLNSPINGQIRVVKSRNKYSVFVRGFEQSGPIYVEKVWHDGLKKITGQPEKILILGLGCGTMVHLLNRKWPKAKIVGVEIDPVMISLGKRYFSLGDCQNLKIIQSSAQDFLTRTKACFDLIFVDIYVGSDRQELPEIPKKLLTDSGRVIINHLNPKSLVSKLQIVLK